MVEFLLHSTNTCFSSSVSWREKNKPPFWRVEGLMLFRWKSIVYALLYYLTLSTAGALNILCTVHVHLDGAGFKAKAYS